jgi:hypothetical protein
MQDPRWAAKYAILAVPQQVFPSSAPASRNMNEDGSHRARSDDCQGQAKMWFQRFLRTDSPWSKPVWVFFCCALVLCRMQAVPSWTHPSLRLGWDPHLFYVIIGVSGAVTGLLVAQYRLLGLVAGALAGSGSVLAAAFVLPPINSYSRIVEVAVQLAGLLPGVVAYCFLHVVVDGLKVKASPFKAANHSPDR